MPNSVFQSLVIQNLTTYSANHFANGRFFDDFGDPSPPKPKFSFQNMLKFAFSTNPDVTDFNKAPFRKIDPLEFKQGPGVRFWWIGHATCLFQLGKTFVITDPIFTRSASPIHGFLNRLVPPAVSFDDLPQISYLILSHDHYDHLDSTTMKLVKKRFPNITVITGLKMDQLISKYGLNSVCFDWRQTATTPEGITFTCMPARHYTNRYGLDYRRRLWTSWIISFETVSIYFPGDTAIGPHFSEVRAVLEAQGRRLDLVPVPIGPKEPKDSMRAFHLDPQEAYSACKEMQAVRAVPIHWGVFALGYLSEVTDIERVKQLWADDSLRPLKVGGALEWNGRAFEEATDSFSLLEN